MSHLAMEIGSYVEDYLHSWPPGGSGALPKEMGRSPSVGTNTWLFLSRRAPGRKGFTLEGFWGAILPLPNTHLEDAGGPGAKGLLLAAEFVPFAQGQDPLATQLLQPGVYCVGKGTKMGVCARSQPEDGEPEETKRVLSGFSSLGLG